MLTESYSKQSRSLTVLRTSHSSLISMIMTSRINIINTRTLIIYSASQTSFVPIRDPTQILNRQSGGENQWF